MFESNKRINNNRLQEKLVRALIPARICEPIRRLLRQQPCSEREGSRDALRFMEKVEWCIE